MRFVAAPSFQCKCLDELNGDRYLIHHQLPSPPPTDGVAFTHGDRVEPGKNVPEMTYFAPSGTKNR